MAGPIGVSEPEKLDLGSPHAAFGEVGPGFGAAGPLQPGPEGLLGQFVHLVDRGAQFGVGVGVFGAFGQGDAATLVELLQRFVKADPLDFLDEFEDIAALAAAEAFEELVVGVDAEGGSFFRMERAETGVALGRSHSSEADVLAHYPDDVNRSFDLRREVQFTNDSAASPAQETRLRAAPSHRIAG